MARKPSNQIHDRHNQPGTALDRRPAARPTGSAWGMDRALDATTPAVLHRSHLYRGRTIRRGDGLVARAGARVDCRDQVSRDHSTYYLGKRVAERNARSIAGLE